MSAEHGKHEWHSWKIHVYDIYLLIRWAALGRFMGLAVVFQSHGGSDSSNQPPKKQGALGAPWSFPTDHEQNELVGRSTYQGLGSSTVT